jgi:hypothetical protein
VSVVSRQFGADGPLISIEVALPAGTMASRRQQGLAIPPALALTALIDTGSDVSVIDARALAPLVKDGLQLSFIHLMNIPALHQQQNWSIEYQVSLTIEPVPGKLRSGLILTWHPIYEESLGLLGYDALIGRDVLEKCALFIDGPASRFTLSF